MTIASTHSSQQPNLNFNLYYRPAMDPNVKGIPDFWYTIFRNVSMLSEMMQEHDEPIVKALQDIKVQMHEDPIGFTLEFHFGPNEYFTNKVLTKEYSMKCKPDDENPLEFEGPEIYSCKGCDINWNKGKNVTVKTIKKKQKHKSRGSVRTVTKSVQADSFFNFFSPPTMPDDSNSTLASDIQVHSADNTFFIYLLFLMFCCKVNWKPHIFKY